ncbi:MAG: hypothetical protein ACLSVD_11375 [Eggerthellaceae bacterium]
MPTTVSGYGEFAAGRRRPTFKPKTSCATRSGQYDALKGGIDQKSGAPL